MGASSENSISPRELYNRFNNDRTVRRLVSGNAQIANGDHTKFMVMQEGLAVTYVASSPDVPESIEIYKAPGINSYSVVAQGAPGTAISATKVEGTTKSTVTDTTFIVDDNSPGIRLTINRATTIPTIALTLL